MKERRRPYVQNRLHGIDDDTDIPVDPNRPRCRECSGDFWFSEVHQRSSKFRVRCGFCGYRTSARTEWKDAKRLFSERRQLATRDGRVQFRVNRHHRKRAWQERDAVVDALDAFFRGLCELLFLPKNPTIRDLLHLAFGGMFLDHAPELRLFAPRGVWRPSPFKRWSERKRWPR